MATSSLDMSFKTAMREHLNQFYNSLHGDVSSFLTFLHPFTTFTSSILAQQSMLQKETLSSAYDFALIVESATTGIMQLERKVDSLDQGISTDVSRILDGVNNLYISDKPGSTGTLPAYIAPCYKWLLENLHNPYPNKEFKKTVAHDSHTAVKDIDSWFIDIRKRIGWNKLRKCHFGNKQDKIIAAATEFFRPTTVAFKDVTTLDLASEVDNQPNLRSHFILLERAARALYPNKFPELASENNRFIDQYPLPSTLKSPESRKSRIDDAALAYPSPTPSLENDNDDPSPVPQISISALPLSHSRKRRQSFGEQDVESDGQVRHKRPRFECPLEENVPSVTSPSSTCESGNSDEVTRHQTLTNSPIVEPSAAPHLKRKRRLSDGDLNGPAKRPHNALCMPRLQTVSDPLPITKLSPENILDKSYISGIATEHDFDDTIPSPANTENLETLSASQCVDVQQYNFSPYDHHIFLPEVFALESAPVANNSESLTTFDTLSFINDIQDATFDLSDASTLEFHLMDAPSYSLDLQYANVGTPDDFLIYHNPELLSLECGQVPDPSLFPAYSNSSDLVAPPSTFPMTPVLGDFNHIIRPTPLGVDEKEIRRARAQALREELAQLAAEGL